MTSHFSDHFSDHSKAYGEYRPHYPDELYFHLSHLTAKHNLAWDCATGTGQAAVQLAKYYKQVIATDASENQIKQAQQGKNIRYTVAAAEHSGIETNSVDLITVAQALHWFNLETFAQEAERVLVEKGILAAWTYNLLNINPEIDRIIEHLYGTLLDGYWPAERKRVENGYQDIQLPFNELQAPPFEMSLTWNLQQLVGYLNTWSAVKRYETDKDTNPVDIIYPELKKLWQDEEQICLIKWPLALRLWCKA